MPDPAQIAVELAIVGLCTILNPTGSDKTIVEPSVIAVKADHHVAYLAYDKKTASLPPADEDKFTPKKYPDSTEGIREFAYLPITGMQVVIDGHPESTPRVLPSFNALPHLHRYWPASGSEPWDPRFVPAKEGKPSADVVTAFFRFGDGRLGAGWMSKIEWEFKGGGASVPPFQDFVAQRATYSFDADGDSVTVILRPIGSDPRPNDSKLKFTRTKEDRIRLWIGNNIPDEIHAVLGEYTPYSYDEGVHFKDLHKMKGKEGPSPIPKHSRPKPPVPSPVPGAGGSGGLCGPTVGGGGGGG